MTHGLGDGPGAAGGDLGASGEGGAGGTASGVPPKTFQPGDLAFPPMSAPTRAPRPRFSPSGNPSHDEEIQKSLQHPTRTAPPPPPPPPRSDGVRDAHPRPGGRPGRAGGGARRRAPAPGPRPRPRRRRRTFSAPPPPRAPHTHMIMVILPRLRPIAPGRGRTRGRTPLRGAFVPASLPLPAPTAPSPPPNDPTHRDVDARPRRTRTGGD